ncbi:MAG: hypothetical protein ACHP65_10195 [Legionellales bacterium]
MKTAKVVLTPWCFLALVTLLIAGCISPEQGFKNNLDAHINWNIEHYQKIYGVDLIRSEERTDGKVEYFYQYITQGFSDLSGSKSCYVMVVDKSSQIIVSWHFIDSPDHCRISK